MLESSLYCPDLEAAERFYREVLGLELVGRRAGRHVFLRCGEGMVLLFDPEATGRPDGPGDDAASMDTAQGGAGAQASDEEGGIDVPSHGARGPGHLAFRVGGREIERWRGHLREAGVPIEAEVSWPGGGRSLYVRDPAGNSIELATGAVWGFEECPS